MKKDIRIKRPKDKEELFNQLLYNKKTNKYGVFSSYYEVMTFAASIGIKHKYDIENSNGYVEFTDSLEPVGLNRFNRDFIDMVVIKHKNDAKYLDWEDDVTVDEKVKIFESYINGGLEIIKKAVESSKNTLDDLTQFMLKELSTEEKIDVDSILNGYND